MQKRGFNLYPNDIYFTLEGSEYGSAGSRSPFIISALQENSKILPFITKVPPGRSSFHHGNVLKPGHGLVIAVGIPVLLP
jgi:hypothetical protein